MNAHIYYSLLKRYDNIVSVFTDNENNDVAIIECTRNKLWYELKHPQKERYLVTFNFLTSPCCIGRAAFPTKEEAEAEVLRLRPHAILVY